MRASRKAPLGFAALCAILLAFLLVPAAHAEPKVTLDDVEQAYHEAEEANERFNALSSEMKGAQAEIDDLEADLKTVRREYDRQRDELASVIVQQQMDAPLGPTVNLLGSKDPEEFLDGLSAVQAFNTSRADALEEFSRVTEQLEARQSALEERKADLAKTKKDAAKNKAAIQTRYDRAKAAFDALSENDQEAFRTQGGTVSRSAPRSIPQVDSAVAQQVLNYVYGQVGKQYCWGGTGPTCFDCSGLAYAAYRSAGVGIPRTPPYGNTVPLSAIQPGDILWNSWHVAIYIGNGQYIHAANPEEDVVVGSLANGWFNPAAASRFG